MVGISEKNPFNIEPSGSFIAKFKLRAVNLLYPLKINNLHETDLA